MSAAVTDAGQAPAAPTLTQNANDVQHAQVTADGDGHDSGDEDEEDDEDDEYDSEDGFSDTSSDPDSDLRENSRAMTLFESSFTTNTRRTPRYTQSESLRTPSLVYDHCSPATLKGFISQRSLPDPYPAGLTLKHFYLKALHEGDRAWRFRFLDLPAEMRNHVYRYLLTWPKDNCPHHRYSHPQILVTCKQAYREAKDILYAENVVTIALVNQTCPQTPLTETLFTVQLHKKALNSADSEKISTIPGGVTEYPPYLRSIERLHLVIYIHRCCMPDFEFEATENVRRSLTTLVSFLMNNHRIKEFDLDFIEDGDTVTGDGYELDLDDIEEMLYPLRRLTSINKVSITHNGHPDLIAGVAQDMQRNTVENNTVEHLRLITIESELLLTSTRVVKVCDLLGDDPCNTSFYRKVSDMLDAFDYWQEEGLVGTASEEGWMRETTAKLQRLLDGMDSNLVAEHSEAYRRAREERQLFEQTYQDLVNKEQNSASS